MRHEVRRRTIVGVLLAVLHLLATAWLAGLVWVVQLVVYPAFAHVGPTSAWAEHHARHSSGMVLAVGPPWLLQGVCVALLLADPSPLVLLAALLAALPVAVTVLVSVPLHVRLRQGWDAATGRRLVTTNWLRTVTWTVGAGVAAALVVQRAA